MGTLRVFGYHLELMPTVAIVVGVVAIASLGSLATDPETSWYEGLRKPEWQPPGWVFGPVWTVIYLLLIISATIAWHATSGSERTAVMILYALNGAMNLAWVFIFFQSRSPFIAAIDIAGVLLTIAWIMVKLWPIAPVASGLLLPYLLWVGFATALNWSIARMN